MSLRWFYDTSSSRQGDCTSNSMPLPEEFSPAEDDDDYGKAVLLVWPNFECSFIFLKQHSSLLPGLAVHSISTYETTDSVLHQSVSQCARLYGVRSEFIFLPSGYLFRSHVCDVCQNCLKEATFGRTWVAGRTEISLRYSLCVLLAEL